MFDQFPEDARIDLIRENIRTTMAERGLKARPFSEKINSRNPNMVGKILGGGGITMQAYISIETSLGLEPGELMRSSPAATVSDINALFDAVEQQVVGLKLSKGPSVVQFLQWYNESGGEISTDSEMLEYLDLYDAPTDSGFLVNPARLGRKSLLSKKVGHVPADLAVEKLAESNLSFTAETAKAHRQVLLGRSIIDEREVNQTLSDGAVITGRFERVLQPGTWAGRKVVLNFARGV